MKTSNPYLLAEIDSIEELFGRDASELEIVKHIDALTKRNRLLQLENEQLAKDKAEMVGFVRKIHLIMRNTKGLPDDYSHEDVGELDDRFNEISGLNHSLYLKYIVEVNK